MSRKDGVLALLVVVVWGLNFVVIKVGLHNMPPLMLAGLRFMLVAFPAIFFVARPKVPLNLLLGYGLTISFAQFAFLFCAINFGMPAGLASLVLQAQAFFTIVLGAFTFGERLHGKQLAGIALAIFGVLVLIEDSLNGQHVAMLGFMLTLAAAFSWACGNIFNKKIHVARNASGSDVAGNLERINPNHSLLCCLADSRWFRNHDSQSGYYRYDHHLVSDVSGVCGDNCWLWDLGDVTGTL